MKITIDEALQRGIEAQKADQLAEADSYYTAILNVQPRHPEANHNMGLIVLSRGSLEKAITFFKIAIEANPAIEQFWISYINTLLDLNQIEQAQKALSEAKGYNFRGDAIGKFEELIKPFGGRSISNSVGREPSDDQLQLITELYFKGELQLTLDRAHGLLEKFPESSSLLNILGSCFAQLNRHDDAIKCFQKMIVVKPFDSDLHFNLGKVFLDTKQIDCALRAFLSSVEINPLDHESFFYIGNCQKQKANLPDAIKNYRQALELKPDFADAFNNLGIALQEQGELLEAIHSYAQAIEIKPESDEAFYNMGVVLKRVRFQNNIPYLPKILILLLSKKTFVNPSDVLFASTSLLKFDPAIRCAMKHQAANEIETLLPEIMTDLSQVQLLTSVMASCPIADLELEALLSKIRSAALFALPKLESTPAILSFQAVLALQCFINEYIYSQTESETQAIYEIEKSIESGLRLGQQPHPTFLACLASYKTLSECSWSHLLNVPDALQELVHMQIYNAEKERRIKSVIPTLKEIKDEISSKVRHQYEENPYPRWINTHLHAKTKSISEVIYDLDLRVIDEGKSFEHDHPKILVAGCGTGQHSINASSRYSSSQLLAIDLSLSSLAYAKRKTEELGVTNIEYMQADIMDLELLERKFDLIESSGVLHHMANPVEGWKVLTRCLKPGGLMKIGLYSERARRHIVLLRQEITDSQFSVNDADMRLFRSQLIKSELAHHKKILLSQDFYSLSALRDLLFHVKEQRFTLPMIRQALEGLGLKFCGFESKEIVRKFKAWCRENDAAYDLVKWDQFEEENPDTFTGMYLFWCQKIAESD